MCSVYQWSNKLSSSSFYMPISRVYNVWKIWHFIMINYAIPMACLLSFLWSLFALTYHWIYLHGGATGRPDYHICQQSLQLQQLQHKLRPFAKPGVFIDQINKPCVFFFITTSQITSHQFCSKKYDFGLFSGVDIDFNSNVNYVLLCFNGMIWCKMIIFIHFSSNVWLLHVTSCYVMTNTNHSVKPCCSLVIILVKRA